MLLCDAAEVAIHAAEAEAAGIASTCSAKSLKTVHSQSRPPPLPADGAKSAALGSKRCSKTSCAEGEGERRGGRERVSR